MPQNGLGDLESAWLFRHLCRIQKPKSPEVRHALPIRMLPNSPDSETAIAASQRGAVQGTRPLWTLETITARSGCRSAVIAAMTLTDGFSAVRQRLREWLYEEACRSTTFQNQIGVRFRVADATGSVAVDHTGRLAPAEAGASWRALRFWIKTGFDAPKSVGWQKTRRTAPKMTERRWLAATGCRSLRR